MASPLVMAAPSERISPSSHCHPLGTKWVGLKRSITRLAGDLSVLVLLPTPAHSAVLIKCSSNDGDDRPKSAPKLAEIVVKLDTLQAYWLKEHASDPTTQIH